MFSYTSGKSTDVRHDHGIYRLEKVRGLVAGISSQYKGLNDQERVGGAEESVAAAMVHPAKDFDFEFNF